MNEPSPASRLSAITPVKMLEIQFPGLKSALEAFHASLEDQKFKDILPKFATIEACDLDKFLLELDKNRQPFLNLTTRLTPIKNVIDLANNTGCGASNPEDEATLRQLFGCLHFTIWAAHKDIQPIVSLSEETGRIIRPQIQKLSRDQVSSHMWECICQICEEITRLCTIYMSQGISLAEKHAHSITWNQIRDAQTTYRTLQRQDLIHSQISDERDRAIRRWLSATDPSSDLHAALDESQSNTGLWLLESSQFARWKNTNNSLLWLYGKPGCGKTILASTAIESILQHIQTRPSQAVAYFYFTFRDTEKQGPQNLLRSLISQLIAQSENYHQAAEELFYACNSGQRQPSIDELIHFLRKLIEKLNETFLILDALDECEEAKRHKSRQDTFRCLQTILEWKLETLHIIITSRPENDIEDLIQPFLDDNQKIFIQSALVDRDIRIYVKDKLHNDSAFSRWKNRSKVQEEIETNLMEKADGMFRWAQCQLDTLRSCVNLPMLRTALGRLPHDLDETYARILSNIKPELRSYVVSVLRWLLYSKRPLRLEEIVDVLAVKSDPEFRFDPENRFPEPRRDILNICSSLVTTISTTHYVNEVGTLEVEELVLAHFSVKEYLVSERVYSRSRRDFDFQERSVHKEITEICLAYLLYFDKPMTFTAQILQDFPLFQYSADFWMQHARKIDRKEDFPLRQSLELLQPYCDPYINWYSLYNRDSHLYEPIGKRDIISDITPLYLASVEGIYWLVQELLQLKVDVNSRGGKYGNALQGASVRGHLAIVMLLLESGAEINTQGGCFGNALQAAIADGNLAISMFLLNKGADMHAQSGFYGNALQAALVCRNSGIVALLLERGVDVNGEGGFYGNALYAATVFEHRDIVELLLDNGADINAEGGQHGNALNAATAYGRHDIEKLLLENGAVRQQDSGLDNMSS